MNSQVDTNLADRSENESQDEGVQKRKLEMLKREYEKRVAGSKLGRVEKEDCLKWIVEGKDIHGKTLTAQQLESALEKFETHEADSLRLVTRYQEKVEDFIRRGLLSSFTKDGKDRLQAELEWFTDLTYENPHATIDKRRALLQSDIDDQERVTVKEIWDRLPRAFRERYQDIWNHKDLDGRKKLVYPALERHESLKARFLKLPPEIQEQHRETFKKIADFDKREIFLIKIEETLKKQEEQGRKTEAARLHLNAKVTPAKVAHAKTTPAEKGEEGALTKAKAWFLKTLRALALSSNPSAAETIETYAISSEVKKRRKRAEVEFSAKTHEALQDEGHGKADARDHIPSELTIQTRILRENRAQRQRLKRVLRPGLQDTNAVLTHAKLENESGRELTADEFGQTELLKQRTEVEKTVLRHAPRRAEFDASALKKAVKEISSEELEAASRESIRKAA